MSGHSKWSKVKHQKATTDAVKSREFTRASRALTVAVREGGGIYDPDKNFRLRLAIDHARSVNMPKETIERAIDRARGSDGSVMHTIMYEGYGPGGVGFLVEVTTDNHQRSSAVIKHEFHRAGGSIASPGAVSYLFEKRGLLLIEKEGLSFDALLEAAIAAGAEDVAEKDEGFEVYTHATGLFSVREGLSSAGIPVIHSALIMHPKALIRTDAAGQAKNEELVALLESSDDVAQIFTNMEVV